MRNGLYLYVAVYLSGAVGSCTVVGISKLVNLWVRSRTG